MRKISELKEIKDGWYNGVLDEPLNGNRNSNIQCIFRHKGIYSVLSLKPMTIEEIEMIDLSEYNFITFKELTEIGREVNV